MALPRERGENCPPNGCQLTPSSNGIGIILHTREGERAPCCAELISGDHYAEIGLWLEGNELADFDGVFWLPHEVGEIACAIRVFCAERTIRLNGGVACL